VPKETVAEVIPAEQAKEEAVKDAESAATVGSKEGDEVLPAKAEPEPKEKKPAPVAEIGKAAPVVRPGSEAWLLQQSPGSYTLQLIGVQEEAGVSRFLGRHQLPGQTAYFRTSREGKPWFPVLYGIYPNRNAAVAARDRLPESLKKAGAWPRSLESVQKEIRSR
jgi:DamX protein